MRRLGIVLLVLLTAACVSPSRTDHDFEKKASHSAKAVASAVSTVLLAVQAATNNDASGPYLSVVLGDVEKDAESVQSQFDSVQPPSDAADRIRATLDQQLSSAIQTMQDVRITARRGELNKLAEVAKPLHDALTQLNHLAQEWA